MVKLWSWIFQHVLRQGYRIIGSLFHTTLALTYWGRGKIVPPVKNPLLLKSATALAADIREGKLKSEDVVHAYMERILEVEPYINATVDRCFLDAMDEARKADALIASGKLTRKQLELEKPLLGVPFTVKVLLTVKGLRSTAGSLLFQDVRATEDAPCVALMKKAGAIVISTTNSAEMGMHFETNNNLHGKTCNPYNTSRTSGGSSGGESALIGAAGSVIGLGNDLAGSIRIPCYYTGIFGHKATKGAVSNKGCFPVPNPKLETYLYNGPMCRYAADLITTMTVLTSQNEKPMKFAQSVNFKDLKIYYMLGIDDPLASDVDLEIQFALKNVVSYFQTHYGCKTKEVEHSFLKHSKEIYAHGLVSATENITRTLTAGKGMNPKTELLKFLFRRSTLSIGPLLVMNFSHNPLVYNESNVSYYNELLQKIGDKFNDMLDETSVFLLPTSPITAPYHYESSILLPNVCYTGIFNLRGLPVTQCPLGTSSKGLPLGIQIVGRKDNDPLTIACAVELEKSFGGWVQPGRNT